MKNQLIHPKTAKQVSNYLKNPFHVILLVGPKGIGKKTITNNIIEGLTSSDRDVYPYIYEINGEKSGIEDIRQLRIELSHAFSPKDNYTYRFVVIKSLEGMGYESHAALLKIIEEPPTHTLIILEVSSQQDVPHTITSRVVAIEVLPVTLELFAEYLKNNRLEPIKHESLWHRHRGYSRYILDELDSNVNKNDELIELAKQFMQVSLPDRLAMVNNLTALDKSKQKEVIKNIISILQYKLEHANNLNLRVLQANEEALSAIEQTDQSVNAKLIWLNLSYNI